ncbi:MAG: Gfo/Idh/MocA family oxidoreductase [Rhodothermales bacterium]|nr:Gfo/Idh/MocA family oxidoreductase [Rhodothermales bacterium]
MPLDVAILGTGGIVDDRHAPALASVRGVRLRSVLSRDLRRAVSFATRHGAAGDRTAFTDLAELLADDGLDAILVATPDRFHAEQTVACLDAGKHVLLEKPMATTLDECDAIINAARRNARVVGIAYHLRHHAGHRELRRRVADGALGDLRHMRVHWTFRAQDASNWRASPQTGRWWSLAANGTHCIDQIRWFMAETCGAIVDVRALASRARFGSTHDETTAALLGFESGATAEICVSVQFDSASRVEIYGDRANAVCDDTLGRHGGGRITLDRKPIEYEPSDPFAGEWKDFADAIRDDRPPEVDAIEGRRNVELMLRIAGATGTDPYAD